MSDLEYSGCGQFCAELDRLEHVDSGSEPTVEEVLANLSLDVREMVILNLGIRVMGLGDFHLMYDLSKRMALDLFALEPGRLRGGVGSLDETQALNLIQRRMPTYLRSLHDEVDEDGKRMVFHCATLMVRHTALLVHILVEAYRDAQIDFLRSVVHEQAVS